MRLDFETHNENISPLHDPYAVEDNILDTATLLKKGVSAAQAGDRELSRKFLHDAVSQDPQCTDAWMWLASIAEYPEELLACLDNVLKVDPANLRALDWHAATLSLMAKTFVSRGNAAQDSGDVHAAIGFYDQAIATDDASEAAWFGKAMLSADDDEKLDFLKRVLSINVDNAEAREAMDEINNSRLAHRLAEAKNAAVNGNNADALSILEQVLDADSTNVEAWMLRSHLATDLVEKLHSLERVLEIDPDHAAAKAGRDFLSSAISVETPSQSEPSFDAVQEVEAVEEFTAPEAHPQDDEQFEAAEEFVPEEAYPQEEEQAEPVAEVEFSEPEPYIDPYQTITNIPAARFEDTSAPEEFDAVPVGYEYDQVDEADEAREVYAYASADDDVPSEEDLNADRITEESLDVEEFVADAETVAEVTVDEVFEQTQEAYAAEEASAEPAFETPVLREEKSGVPCPYCWESNEANAFECGSCRAVLTMADIERLISNPQADRDTIQTAVTQMEAEWNLREFNSEELIALGIGHFNLGNHAPGVKYLQEASLLRPNDVILSSNINTLVIRLDEVRRQAEINAGRPQGRRILVVDDSATVRKLISGKLEKSGHTVVCAEDGVDGLRCINEQLPDLVLLDITMPRMDGYEVCRQIRSNPNSKDVPVVMISGKDGFFDKVRGRMAGTTAYITKPFGPETLMKALENYLTGEPQPAVSVEEFEEEPVAA